MEDKMNGENGKCCDGNCGSRQCGCGHHRTIPVLFILFGLLFLAGTLGWVSDYVVNVGWPILAIVAGFSKISQRKCTCC